MENSPSKTVLLTEVRGIYANVLSPTEANGVNNVHSSVTNVGNGANVWPFVFGNPGGNLTTGCLGGDAGTCTTATGNTTGRHTGGSVFLMCDGHAKWLNGASVSSGSVAYAPDCNEHGVPALTDCPKNNTQDMAAGTDNSGYAATFSTI